MITERCHDIQDRLPAANVSLQIPPSLIEYGYYFTLFYATLSGAFQLSIEKVGVLMLTLLVLLCVLGFGPRVLTVFQLTALPIGCGIVHLVVQLLIHEESLESGNVRNFLPWMLGLVIIQSLALRKGFLHRFALVMLLIGLAMLPFLNSYNAGGYERVGLDRAVGYANPNALGAWFGFCAVYFTTNGYVVRRNSFRLLSWLLALGCMYVSALTVSRGSLLAVSIAVLFASRHLLKRGFVPIVLLATLGGVIVESGIFDDAIRSYGYRSEEGSARLQAWPLLVEIFLNSPLIGVGLSHAYVVVPGSGKATNAHNAFLFIAVASGTIPLALFVAYWIRSVMAALRANFKASPDAVFYIPLLIYTFLIISVGNMDFMAPWAIVSLAVPLAANGSTERRREASIKPTISIGCIDTKE